MAENDSSEGDFLSQTRSVKPQAASVEPIMQPVAQAAPQPMLAEQAPVAPVVVDSPGESGLGKKPAETKPMRIGEKLINLGLISKDQLEIALREQQKSKKLLGAIMISMNFITESALGEVLAESSGSERFDARSTMLDANLLALVPRDVCVRNKVIPVEQSGQTVKLAMVDVYNVLAIDQVRRHLDKSTKIIPIFCTETEVNDLIERYYNYDLSIDGVLREIETGIREKTQLDGREEGYVNPTVRLVNALLIDAIKQGIRISTLSQKAASCVCATGLMGRSSKSVRSTAITGLRCACA
jgi:hypothetical protein